jgi:hypothetical protein
MKAQGSKVWSGRRRKHGEAGGLAIHTHWAAPGPSHPWQPRAVEGGLAASPRLVGRWRGQAVLESPAALEPPLVRLHGMGEAANHGKA